MEGEVAVDREGESKVRIPKYNRAKTPMDGKE
jgi:hypothetical protein